MRTKTNAQLGGGAPGSQAPPVPDQPSTTDGRRSTADLVRGIAEDASTLVRQELLLARQELTEGATTAAKAGAVLAAAGVIGLFALGFVLTTLAWGIVDLGLPRWAGFGIVALLLLIVTAVLGLIGQRRFAKAKLRPDRARAEFKLATSELVEGARIGADNVRAEAVATAEAVKVGAVTLPDRARTAAAAGRIVRRVRARLTRQNEATLPGSGRGPGT